MIFKRNKGFTLVEVFLVAALTSVVLLTIFSAYFSGIRIWKTIKDLKLMENRTLYTGIIKVKRGLLGYTRDFKEIAFEGENEWVSFPGVSGLEIVKVTYEFDKIHKTLLKKTLKYSNSLKDKMDEEKISLFDADDVKFYYLFYNAEAKEEADNWLEAFSESSNGIPRAVRLDISIKGREFSEYVFMPQ